MQECAKVHSTKFREYVQCTEMIIQKMCVNVTCSDYVQWLMLADTSHMESCFCESARATTPVTPVGATRLCPSITLPSLILTICESNCCSFFTLFMVCFSCFHERNKEWEWANFAYAYVHWECSCMHFMAKTRCKSPLLHSVMLAGGGVMAGVGELEKRENWIRVLKVAPNYRKGNSNPT